MADGGVSWNFKRAGIITIAPEDRQREEVINAAIENEAEDVVEDVDQITIYSTLDHFNQLKEKLSVFKITESNVGYVPLNPVQISPEQKVKYDKLIEDLTDHPDVQEVFDNLT